MESFIRIIRITVSRYAQNYPLMLLLILIFCVACDDEISKPYEPQFNVYAVLRNDKVIQEVFVDRTYFMEEPSENYIDDALVILSGIYYIDTLIFSDSLLRYTTSDTFALLPLETYRLVVAKEGFDTLFGETMIPGGFDFIWPSEGDTMTVVDSIIFRKNTGVSIYFCYFWGLISDTWYTTGTFVYEPVASETLVKIPLYDYFSDYPSGMYTITFSALDSNFYEYYNAPDNDLVQAGIENGVGLFGSASVDSIVNYIITE